MATGAATDPVDNNGKPIAEYLSDAFEAETGHFSVPANFTYMGLDGECLYYRDYISTDYRMGDYYISVSIPDDFSDPVLADGTYWVDTCNARCSESYGFEITISSIPQCGGDYNGIYTCCPSAEILAECQNSSDGSGCSGCTRPTCEAANGVLACCPSEEGLDSCMLSSSVSCPTCSSGCSGCIYPTLENWLNYYNSIGVVKVAGAEFDPSIGKTVFGRYLGDGEAGSYQNIADDVGANKFYINVEGLSEEEIQALNDIFTRAAGKDAAENGGSIFVTERPPADRNDVFWEGKTGFAREMKILTDEFKGVVTEEPVPVTGPNGVTRYLYEVEIPTAAEIINTIIMCALI